MKNASTGQIKIDIQECILGGLIFYHNLTLVQKNCPLKKIANILVNQFKITNYAGCLNKFTAKHLANFWHFWRPHETNWYHILKSVWKVGKNDVGSELRFFFKNQCYGGLKSWFSDRLSFTSTLKKVKCLKTRAFLTILKVPEEKKVPPLKSVLKVGKIMWTLYYILYFQKMLWRLKEKNRKKTGILTFCYVAITYTLAEKL